MKSFGIDSKNGSALANLSKNPIQVTVRDIEAVISHSERMIKETNSLGGYFYKSQTLDKLRVLQKSLVPDQKDSKTTSIKSAIQSKDKHLNDLELCELAEILVRHEGENESKDGLSPHLDKLKKAFGVERISAFFRTMYYYKKEFHSKLYFDPFMQICQATPEDAEAISLLRCYIIFYADTRDSLPLYNTPTTRASFNKASRIIKAMRIDLRKFDQDYYDSRFHKEDHDYTYEAKKKFLQYMLHCPEENLQNLFQAISILLRTPEICTFANIDLLFRYSQVAEAIAQIFEILSNENRYSENRELIVSNIENPHQFTIILAALRQLKDSRMYSLGNRDFVLKHSKTASDAKQLSKALLSLSVYEFPFSIDTPDNRMHLATHAEDSVNIARAFHWLKDRKIYTEDNKQKILANSSVVTYLNKTGTSYFYNVDQDPVLNQSIFELTLNRGAQHRDHVACFFKPSQPADQKDVAASKEAEAASKAADKIADTVMRFYMD